MAKRKKRLEKAIFSVEEQKILHGEKRKIAMELGQEELVEYYNKEIESLEKRKRDRGEKLHRKD